MADGTRTWGSASSEADAQLNIDAIKQHIMQDPLLGSVNLDSSGIGYSLLDNEDLISDDFASPHNSTILDKNYTTVLGNKRGHSPEDMETNKKRTKET